MSGNTVGLYGSTTTANVAGGNVTGLYQQTQAVVVDNGYNNADVEAFLETYTGNIQCGNIDVLNTANINALFATNYYYANGTPFVPSGYGNANVAAFLPTYTGDLAGSNLGITANILVGQNLVTSGNITGAQNITAGGDVQAAGNLRTTGVAGNITGANYVVAGFFVGDGSQLSNVSGSYGNAQVANLLASGTLTSNIITTGNVAGTYFLGNGSQLTGLPATYSDANVVTLLAAFGSNTIVTTGNVTGGNFVGSGAALTNITGANVTGQVANALVAGTVYTAAQPNITSVGTLTGLSVAGNISTGNIEATGNVTVGGTLHSDDITSVGDVTVYGNQIITGNLTVQGNTTTINSNVITTNDKTITVANNQSTGANVNGAGIEAGNPAIATWLYNDPTTSWQSNISVTPSANLTQDLGKSTNRWATVYAGDANISANVTAVGNISGSYILGNGSQLTGLPEGYGNANVVTLLAAFGSNTISTTGNITGGNLITTTNIVIPTNGKITGDFSSAVTAGRTLFQTTNTGTTAPTQITAIPGANNTGTNRAGMFNYQLADVANSAFGGTQMTATDFRISVGRNGTANVVPFAIATNNGTTTAVRVTVDAFGNVGIGNTAPVDLLSVAGNAYILGNVTGGNIVGNGQFLTDLPGANVTGTVPLATSATTAGTVTTNAQPNITSVGTLSTLSVTGNIGTGGILTDGYYYANGSPVTFGGNYSNANVQAFLPTYSGNIGELGNISSSLQLNGDQIEFWSSNANVTHNGILFHTPANGSLTAFETAKVVITAPAGSSTNTTLEVAGNIKLFGNGNLVFDATAGGQNGQITTVGNIAGGNISTAGQLTVTGNITSSANIAGSYILGNGSQLTGLPTGGNSFSTIDANGTSIVADSSSDTLTLVAGTNITITGNATTDSITISSTATGGGDSISPFLLMGG